MFVMRVGEGQIELVRRRYGQPVLDLWLKMLEEDEVSHPALLLMIAKRQLFAPHQKAASGLLEFEQEV